MKLLQRYHGSGLQQDILIGTREYKKRNSNAGKYSSRPGRYSIAWVSASDILIDIHLARLCLTGDVLVEHLPDDGMAILKKTT